MLGYSVFIVLLMFDRGLAITPDVMAVAFALAAILLGRGRLFLRDWIPFIALMLAYEMMRGVADNTGFTIHISDMATADRLLTFGHIPTQVLQDALHPAVGIDWLAILATIVYMLHFVLPLVTGFVLWVWRRPHYYDFVAALILLSMAGFVSYLLVPAAPPWYAAAVGALNGPDGRPILTYLKPGAFDQIAQTLGFDGHYLYSIAFAGVNPNSVAAWPSLHVAYPFLSFLFLRRAFGRIGWIGFAYMLLVAFSVIYTGDHWIVDCIAGVAYAFVAYYAVVHSPPALRAWPERTYARLRADLGARLRRPERST